MKRWLHRLGPWALWLGAAIALVGPPTLAERGRVVGRGIDLQGTLWMHEHLRRAVAGEQPFFWSPDQFYPTGKDLLADTGGNILDGFLSLPLRLLAGFPDYLDFATVGLLVANAAAAAFLCRQLGAAPWAAAFLGLVYELEPYALHELVEGRSTQIALFAAPLAVAALLRLGERLRDAALLGALVLIHGFLYWYNVYFFVLGLLPLALGRLWRQPRAIPALLLAMGLAAAGAAPFVVGVHDIVQAGEMPRLVWEEGHSSSPLGRPGLSIELLGRYDSWTWIAVAAGALLAGPRGLGWVIGVIACVGLAIGTQPRIAGEIVPNPYAVWLYDHVPLLPRLAFPDRISSIISLLLVGAAALGPFRRSWLAGVLAVGCITELNLQRRFPAPATVFVEPAAARVVRADPGPVLHLPFGFAEDLLALQVFHGQPIFGGMAEREADLRPAAYTRRLRNPFVVMLTATMGDQEPRRGYRAEHRDAITRLFRWVWMDRRWGGIGQTRVWYDPEAKLRRLSEELGAPVYTDRDVALWDLHALPASPPGFDAPLPSAEQAAAMETLIRARRWSRGLEPGKQERPEGRRERPGTPAEGPREGAPAGGP